ncbi:perlucin-like [Haliotis cracherodii]|uniref:perlucin-like n=1 Tax=Haliotis cracherodii TaxID=6455 RepID=UPI0039E93CC5
MFRKLIFSFLVSYVTALLKIGLGYKWNDFDNVLMSTSVIFEVSNIHTGKWCVLLCLQNEACVSVFHRRQYRRCQFHDVLFMSPGDGEEETGTEYYSLTTGACPSGYVHNRLLNFCYQLHTDSTLHKKALADCACRGEHFVLIDSADKQKHIIKQTNSSSENRKKNFFIDGSDVAEEGKWVYHDGRPMTYFAWRQGYPLNAKDDQDYIVVHKSSEIGSVFMWKDRRPNNTYYYTCQKDL